MRYLLHKTQRGELHARQQYLFDVFRMYFLPGPPEGGFIPLIPVGSGSPNILFITGHADCVEDYLKSMIQDIPERIIVITSCMSALFYRYTAQKEVYAPDPKQPLCYLRDGRPYGFDFEISDEELCLLNSSGTIMDRIRSAYMRL